MSELMLPGSSVLKVKWSRYIPHAPTPKQVAFLALPHREALYGGAAGGGKLLKKGGVLLTPFGWKKCEDLEVGDRVNNPDGSISRIIQLKAWEKLPKYTVYFDDGTCTEVAEEHLWLAWRSGKRKKLNGVVQFGQSGAEVITTRELGQWASEAERQKQSGIRPNYPLIPLCEPQRFNVTHKFPASLCPYVLGALLGDGYIKTKTIKFSCSTEDYPHWQESLAVEHKYDLKSIGDSGDMRILGSDRKYLVSQLNKLGLLGKGSHTKFVPKQYLYSSIESRIALLQGLMDTDGFVDARGQLYYCSVSSKLREDVCFLVRSLGGTAKVFDANEVYITLPSSIQPCRIQRKLNRVCEKNRPPSKKVLRVVKEGIVEGRCISVSHPNGLYITNDFIVTHNSDALLMGALQYFDCPGYKALIIRRSVKEGKYAGAIFNRAKRWLEPFLATKEVKWVSSENTFYSCEGASLAFGYLDKIEDEEQYQGADFLYVGLDELTHYYLPQYEYMFSRVRRGDDNMITTSHIPLRVRGATNPGSRGMRWVKERFKITKDPDGIFRGKDPMRPFIQAKLEDNPFLDQKAYDLNLSELGKLQRDRLRWGDWDASPDAVMKPDWFINRWSKPRDQYYHLSTQQGVKVIHQSKLLLFTSTDVAGSEATGIEGRVLKKSTDYEPAWSVCCLWGMTRDFDLMLLDLIRGQWTVPAFLSRIVQKTRDWKPAFALIEDNSIALAVYQGMRAKGITVKGISSEQDKVVRSTTFQIRAEMGKVFLPATSAFLTTLEDELFTWTGRKGEVCDIIDTASLAGEYVGRKALGSETEDGMNKGLYQARPIATGGLAGVSSSPVAPGSPYSQSGLSGASGSSPAILTHSGGSGGVARIRSYGSLARYRPRVGGSGRGMYRAPNTTPRG